MDKFFIVGCPRSGTTILQQALNRHSQIVMAPETKYFYYFCGMPRSWQVKHVRRLRSDLGIAIGDPPGRVSGTLEHREFFDNLALQYASSEDAAGVRWFGDKTPEHTTRIEAIRSVYPDCPIIFVYRDPRDVVVSLKNVPWIRCGNRSAVMIWRRYTGVLELLRESGDDAHMAVCYEELVRDPETVLRAVCRFLGVSYESHVACGDGDSRLIPQRELAWKSASLAAIDATQVGRWRKVLNAGELVQIERIAGELMVKLNYQPETTTDLRIRAIDSLPLCAEMIQTLSSLSYQCLLSEFLEAKRKFSPFTRITDSPVTRIRRAEQGDTDIETTERSAETSPESKNEMSVSTSPGCLLQNGLKRG